MLQKKSEKCKAVTGPVSIYLLVEKIIGLSQRDELKFVQSLIQVQGIPLCEENWRKSALVLHRTSYYNVLDE